MNTPESNIELQKNPFYRMMECLLKTNEVVLYGRIHQIKPKHELPVIQLLQTIYKEEAADYPFQAPPFNEEAANWSSKLLFYTAQLVLYREHDAETLTEIITPYKQQQTTAAIITADLSLRFLPSLLEYLEKIDVEDELIPLLKEILQKWHYSGLLTTIDSEEELLFTTAYDDPCLLQLYVDRVIEQKQQKVGQLKNLKPLVMSALGNYEQLFWNEFNSTI